MSARHLYGLAVVLESSETRTLVWSCVVDDGTTTYTLDLNDVADPVLTAGTYSPHGFMAHVAKKLRQSLFDRLDGMAETQPGAGGTRPTAVGDLTVDLGLPEENIVEGMNASKLELSFTSGDLAGAETANGPLTLASVTLVNTNGVWSKLGLCTYGETRGPEAPAAGEVVFTGRFQPRWLFVIKASKADSGPMGGASSLTSEPMGDGGAFLVREGKRRIHRDISWVNLPAAQAGPDRVVGVFGDFGASRRILELQTLDETLLRGMTGTYSRTDNLTEGAYLFCGEHFARFHQVSGDTFECFDAWPSTRVPVAGEPILVLSELSALLEEWLRVGLLFIYEPVDLTGVPSWISTAYAPRVQPGGEWRPEPKKHGSGYPLFTVSVSTFLVSNPGLATP